MAKEVEEYEETDAPSQREVEEVVEEADVPNPSKVVEAPRLVSEVTARDEAAYDEAIREPYQQALAEGETGAPALQNPLWATTPDPEDPSRTVTDAALGRGGEDEDYVEGETDEERAERLSR